MIIISFLFCLTVVASSPILPQNGNEITPADTTPLKFDIPLPTSQVNHCNEVQPQFAPAPLTIPHPAPVSFIPASFVPPSPTFLSSSSIPVPLPRLPPAPKPEHVPCPSLSQPPAPIIPPPLPPAPVHVSEPVSVLSPVAPSVPLPFPAAPPAPPSTDFLPVPPAPPTPLAPPAPPAFIPAPIVPSQSIKILPILTPVNLIPGVNFENCEPAIGYSSTPAHVSETSTAKYVEPETDAPTTSSYVPIPPPPPPAPVPLPVPELPAWSSVPSTTNGHTPSAHELAPNYPETPQVAPVFYAPPLLHPGPNYVFSEEHVHCEPLVPPPPPPAPILPHYLPVAQPPPAPAPLPHPVHSKPVTEVELTSHSVAIIPPPPPPPVPVPIPEPAPAPVHVPEPIPSPEPIAVPAPVPLPTPIIVQPATSDDCEVEQPVITLNGFSYQQQVPAPGFIHFLKRETES